MTKSSRVLLVAPTGSLTRSLVSSLRTSGYVPHVVADFVSAKRALTELPDVLVTDLKLGAYNGLHLAIRASVQGTPVVVIGEADSVLEAEAERQHAKYLTPPLDEEQVLNVIRELLSTALRTRRSPRKQVPLLDAFVNDVPARVLDVSYEGMRLEADETPTDALPASFRVRLPLFNFVCEVQRVWMSPMGDESGRSVTGVSCGAELSARDADTALAWRALVDSMPGLAVMA